jgi:hypothetical protein
MSYGRAKSSQTARFSSGLKPGQGLRSLASYYSSSTCRALLSAVQCTIFLIRTLNKPNRFYGIIRA